MEDIIHLLERKIIPWASQSEEQGLIVARRKIEKASLPYGVTITEQPIKGKRVVRVDQRIHGNQRLFVADWPEANLQTIALPKISCIVDGEADYLLGKYSVHCGAGNFILIPAHALHQSHGPFLSPEHLPGGRCSLVQAYAFNHGVHVWYSASRGREHTSSYADHYFIYDQSAANILRILVAAAEEAKPNWNFVCRKLLAVFFSVVTQNINEGFFTCQSVAPIKLSSDADFTSQVKAYIEANCHKTLKLPDVAAHFYMSISQFTRCMRQEGNPSFVEMLTLARIELAKRFLRDTNITFNKIAGYCFFHSDNHFRSLFRKHVGCSPNEYRRKWLPGTPPGIQRKN